MQQQQQQKKKKAPKKMSKRTSLVAHRAWELIRALLCARRGELCRNRIALTINAFSKLIRKIAAANSAASESRTALLYGDHEFSFHGSPAVHVRMHRAPAALRLKLPQLNFPCIAPPRADSDSDSDEEMWRDRIRRDYFLKAAESESEAESEAAMSDESDEGIDERAEEFIAKFYEEMKQQRQISCV